MWLLLVATLAVCAVVAIGAALSSGPKPRHARPRHLEVVRDDRGQVDGYGSMIWAEEVALHHEPAPGLDWRAQTMAELSPAALAVNDQPDPYLDAVSAECGSEYDPGAGGGDVVSSEPAPVPDPPARFTDPPAGGAGDWLEAQMADLYAWVRSVHAGALA